MAKGQIKLGLGDKTTMVWQVMIAMVAAGIQRFDSKLFFEEARNALDLDHYDRAQILADWAKVKSTFTIEQAIEKSKTQDFTQF